MLSVELFLPSEEGWGKLNDGSIEINLTYSLQVPAGDTVALNTSYSSLWFSWSPPMLGRTGTGYTLVRPLWLYNVSLLPPPGPRNLDNIIAQSCVISEESYNCQWSILVFCTDFWLISHLQVPMIGSGYWEERPVRNQGILRCSSWSWPFLRPAATLLTPEEQFALSRSNVTFLCVYIVISHDNMSTQLIQRYWSSEVLLDA